MRDSLHGNISGHNRCIMLGGRYKLRAWQYLWDTTVQYCPAPSAVRAYKTYSYKSEVIGPSRIIVLHRPAYAVTMIGVANDNSA
jgi:hypothetical protein